MAYIALVYVRDDDTAQAIIKGELPMSRKEVRYVGLYRWPTRDELTCDGCSSRKGNGWGRSPQGWMRCSTCGGRSRKVRRWLVGALFDWFGANLLPDPPATFRTPEGYGN